MSFSREKSGWEIGVLVSHCKESPITPFPEVTVPHTSDGIEWLGSPGSSPLLLWPSFFMPWAQYLLCRDTSGEGSPCRENCAISFISWVTSVRMFDVRFPCTASRQGCQSVWNSTPYQLLTSPSHSQVLHCLLNSSYNTPSCLKISSSWVHLQLWHPLVGMAARGVFRYWSNDSYSGQLL